jgi:CheY-like chemotaxis protein
MELTCRQCASRFRAVVPVPLTAPVRVACPSCRNQMVLKPRAAEEPSRRHAVVADEVRPFREFLGEHLMQLGFDVDYFEAGDTTLDFVRRSRPSLLIINVYLKGMLGVEVTEAIRADPHVAETKVILIGALFRANRFRANPTNLYGADEYIEEQIPEKEFRTIIHKLFPDAGEPAARVEGRGYDEARRLARLILSDIVIYHAAKVERGIRENNFFELLRDEIAEGRQYYESRVPLHVRRETEIFSETLKQFVEMKREEMEKIDAK